MTSRTGDITYTYATSPNHRVYHVDGMYGGNTPQNRLVISFFSERPPMPSSATLQIVDGQAIGPETMETDGRPVRDIEASISIDVNTAISFYVWLEDKVRLMSVGAGLDEQELKKILEGLRGGNSGL